MSETVYTRPIQDECSEGQWMPKAHAARVYGITKGAMQKRIDRGTVKSQKINEQWYVYIPAELSNVDQVYPIHPPASIPVRQSVHTDIERLQLELDELKKDRDAWREMALSNSVALRTLALPDSLKNMDDDDNTNIGDTTKRIRRFLFWSWGRK